MGQTTITQALAEIKTLKARRDKKRAGIVPYFFREKQVTDPMEKEGGSTAYIQSCLQSIDDMGKRIVALRTAIQASNLVTPGTVAGQTKTVAEWLTYRKDIAPTDEQFLQSLAAAYKDVRNKVVAKGRRVVSAVAVEDADRSDVIANMPDSWVQEEVDKATQIKGELDGMLSLLNATTIITIPD